MQYVYVLNKHGEPLMPCSPGKARLLLKQQKACVVKRTPFTIKLLYGSAGYKQPITLGVDAGSKHVGLSASTEKRELYREEWRHPQEESGSVPGERFPPLGQGPIQRRGMFHYRQTLKWVFCPQKIRWNCYLE